MELLRYAFLLGIISFIALPPVLSQRIGGAVAQYDLLVTECIAGGPFFNAITNNDAVGGNLRTISDDQSFSCPFITFGNVDFIDSSNGITLANGVPTSGAISDASLDKAAFAAATSSTWEFWLFATEKAADERVLLEISRDAVLDNSVNSWVEDTDFEFRITVQGRNVRVSLNGATATVVLNNDFLGDPDREYVQVTIVLSPNGGDTIVSLFGNGVFFNSATLADISSAIDLVSNPRNMFFVLGGSFEQRLGGAATVVPFDEDIHFFGLYFSALSAADILSNFNEGLENNLPAIVPELAVDHIEDALDTTFALTGLFFDFDVDILGEEGIAFTLRLETEPTFGDVLNGNSVVNAGEDIANEDTVFNYRQDNENDDDLVDSGLTMVVFEQNQFALRSQPVTITFTFIESNDPPTAVDSSFQAGEAQRIEVEVLATEEQDGGDANADHFPVEFEVIAATSDFGVFVLCADNSPLEVGQVVSDFEGDPTLTDFVNRKVCFIAESFEGVVDALIGTDVLTFTVTDGGGLRSANTGEVSVDVLSAISTGCDFVADPSRCEDEINELDNGDFFEITLVGFDSKCDETDDPDPACPQRIKEFIVVGPLPDPETEGEFRFLNENEEEVAITEELLTLSQGEVLIPGASDKLRFYPADFYFNLGTFPICFANANNGFSECVGNIQNGQICTGKFCPAQANGNGFTSGVTVKGDLLRFGTCGEDNVVDGGCPIRVYTVLQVQNGKSQAPDVSQPSQVVWVRNQNTNAGEQKVFPENTDFGNFDPDVPKLLGLNGVEPISVFDPDVNTKNLQVNIEIPGGGVSITTDVGIEDVDVFYFTFDPSFASRVIGEASIEGLQQPVNEFLATLEARIDANLLADVIVVVRFEAPFESGNNIFNNPDEEVQFTLQFEDLEEIDDDNFFNQDLLPFFAGALFLLLLILFCLFAACRASTSAACCCFKNLCLAFRKNVARDKKIKRGRAYSEDSEELERLRKKKCSYKCGVCCYALKIPHLLACLCPCLCAMQEVKSDSIFGDEDFDEEEGIQTHGAKGAVDPDEWEEHEKVVKGRKMKYWYNKRTDKSQWNSPFESSRKKRRKEKGSLEHGEIRLHFKLFKSKKKKDDDSDDDEDEGEDSSRGLSSRRRNKDSSRRGRSDRSQSSRNGSRRAKGSGRNKPSGRMNEEPVAGKRYQARPPPRPKPRNTDLDI